MNTSRNSDGWNFHVLLADNYLTVNKINFTGGKMLDLITILVTLIISLFIIGIFLYLITCQPKSDQEQYYEDLEQMKYLKKHDNKKV